MINMNRVYIGLAALVLIALAIAGHFVQVSGLKADVATLNASNTVLTNQKAELVTANKQCAGSVKVQSAAVDEWKRKADESAQAAKTAEADAERQAAEKNATAARILSRTMSKPGDECGSLEGLINEEIERRKK